MARELRGSMRAIASKFVEDERSEIEEDGRSSSKGWSEQERGVLRTPLRARASKASAVKGA